MDLNVTLYELLVVKIKFNIMRRNTCLNLGLMFQLLAVDLRDRNLVFDRTGVRSSVDKLLHSHHVYSRSVYSKRTRHGLR